MTAPTATPAVLYGWVLAVKGAVNTMRRGLARSTIVRFPASPNELPAALHDDCYTADDPAVAVQLRDPCGFRQSFAPLHFSHHL